MKSLAIVLVIAATLLIQATTPPQRGGNAANAGPQRLAWVDRSGKVIGTIGEPQAAILDPAISPDGKRVAVRGRDKAGETEHAWIHEGTSKHRLTANEGSERHEMWSPSGDRIVFSMQLAGQGTVSNLFIRASDGSGSDKPLVVSEGVHKWSPSWSPDGKTVVYHTNNLGNNARDIWFVNVADGKTAALVDSPAIEALPRFSTDGKFVAYQSDESGKFEVYVTTFPRSAAKWKVSANGGNWARWDKDQIYYWEGNNLMSAKFAVKGNAFTSSAPQKLFAGADVGMGSGDISGYNFFYDFRDGKFIVVQREWQKN